MNREKNTKSKSDMRIRQCVIEVDGWNLSLLQMEDHEGVECERLHWNEGSLLAGVER